MKRFKSRLTYELNNPFMFGYTLADTLTLIGVFSLLTAFFYVSLVMGIKPL